ncbi:MAG: DUF3179 domain-containing protein [Candidatus Diapherotrites archaeon]|nr:DUF3179 domain-containing protein [Candidatus Diapherotrites archaeon]
MKVLLFVLLGGLVFLGCLGSPEGSPAVLQDSTLKIGPQNSNNSSSVFPQSSNGKIGPSSLPTLESPSGVKVDVEYFKKFSAKKVYGKEAIGIDGSGTEYLKTVSQSEILQGCFGGKDCIPSIDQPKFVGVQEASAWLEEGARILGIEIDGVARAYPVKILDYHEIVNDEINEKPFAVTYCPLCGSGVAFHRIVLSEPVKLGVSGKLYQSDLIMYDRKTETYWSQISGEGIQGPLSGYRLQWIPLSVTTWKEWKEVHPDTKVLSNVQDIYSPGTYESYPYGNYESEDSTLFPASGSSKYHSKAWVQGIELEGQFKAWVEMEVQKTGIVNDTFKGQKILVVWSNDAQAIKLFDRVLDGQELEFELKDGVLVDTATQTKWSFSGQGLEGPLKGKTLSVVPSIRTFWFAWTAFHPGTSVWPPQ